MEFIKQSDGFCCYNEKTQTLCESRWDFECGDMYLELYDLEMINYPVLEVDTPDKDLIDYAKKEGWTIIKVMVTFEGVR